MVLVMNMQKYEDLIMVSQTLYQKDPINNLSEAAKIISRYLCEVNWVGFYLFKNNQLEIGPYVGIKPIKILSLSEGICGKSATNKEIITINNVYEFPDYLPIDNETRSKIALPIFKNSLLFGVLTLDSPIYARFEEVDIKYLDLFVKSLEKYI